MKSMRTSMMVLSIATVVVLVFLGAQLQIPTAFALPNVHFKTFAIPSFSSSNLAAPATNTCATLGCHSGTATAGGGVAVVFPSGMTTYTPGGAPLQLSVKVTDPTLTLGGYLLTARLASSVSSQAGSFTTIDANSMMVANGTVQDIKAMTFSPMTWNFDWTPPATNQGDVNFYVTGITVNPLTGFTSGDGVYQSIGVLHAPAPDFSLSASPSSVTIIQGASGTSTMTVTPLNGFTGTVTYTASGLPSGVTATFAGNVMTLAASATAATGASTVTVTGASGALSHTTTVGLTVNAAPDFSLSATPSSVTVIQGASGTSTMTVTPLNSFTGTVSFSASGQSSGVTASFSGSTLTLAASSTATLGKSTVTITGTSGTLSHTTTVGLTVNAAPDFSLSALPSSVTVTQGTSGTSTISVAPLNGFTGTVSFSASGQPSGVTASVSSAGVLTLAASSTATTGTFTVTVTGTSGALSHTTTVGLTVGAAPDFSLSASPSSLTVTQGSSAMSTITVNPLNGFTGSVSFSATGQSSGVTASFSGNTLTLAASSTATVGKSTVTITGTSGVLSHATTVALTVNAPAPTPDFSLSASPSSLTVTQGSSGMSTITVNPLNGFTGSVSFSASGQSSGVTASFSGNTLTLAASSTATVGKSTVTITGTSGILSHATTVALTVNAPAPAPDFSLSASPSSLTVTQGSSGMSTITVNPLNGFTGSVSFSASGQSSGVTASFSGNTLTLAASSTATTGTATVTVTGTSGTLTHTATVGLTVNAAAPASSISATPSTLTFNYPQGSTASGSQPIMVSGNPTGLAYTAAASGASWLSIDSTSGSVPGMINAKVTAGSLLPGTYSGGKVTITSSGATGSPQVVNITLVITPGTTGSSLTVTPSSLNFTYQLGGTVPSSQKLSIGTTGSTPLNYNASYYGSSWVSLNPTSGTTPSPITVSINLPRKGVTAGTYNGQIQISANGATTVNVPVTLTITSSSGGGTTTGTMYAQPYVYDTTSSGALAAMWVSRLGAGTQSYERALVLSKNASAPAGSWAGANILNVTGLSLTELGFDYRDGSQCTSTSPRFVVVTTDAVTHVLGGCTTGTAQTNVPYVGWRRVRFGQTQFDAATPPITPGMQVQSIALVMDQAPESVAGASGGFAVIDNIDVNGTLITGPAYVDN